MAARTVEIAFIGSTAQLEAALARAGLTAEASGKKIGDAFTAGTTRAGGAVTKLGNLGASWGLPFSSSLDKIGKQLDEATSRTQKLHTALAAMGKVTIAAGLGGFAAAAYEGVKGAAQLQKSMEMLHTQAGATQKQVAALQKGVLGMAGSVGTAPNELAQGLYHVVSNMNAVTPAAQRNQKELAALRVAAEGAKVGNANLEDVTNALGAAIASGLPGVQNYTKAMGMLNATVGAGDMRMQDLADALGTGLLGPMKNYGISLRDISAALAVFGDNNIRGQEAATKLNSAIRIMAAPSKAASAALAAVSLSATQLANDMRTGGLIKAISDLKQHLQGSGATASQQALIITRAFGGRQSTGVQLLMGQLDRLKAKYQEVGQGANTFGQSWKATQGTLAFQLDQLKSTVQSLADKFGMYLIPKLEATAKAISSVVSWLQKHKAVAEDVAGVITGVLGAAVAAFAYGKAAAFISAIGGMGRALLGLGATSEVAAGEVDAALSSTGVGAVLVALGIAAGELGTHWSQVMSGMSNAAKAMENAVRGALNVVINVLNSAISAFNDTIGRLTGSIGHIGQLSSGGGGAGSTYSAGGGSSIGVADTRFGAVDVNQNRAGKPNLPLQLPGSSTAMKIANYLGGQGFSKVAIAGILGNFGQESGGNTLSGINPNLSGSSGLGIAQWIGSRRAAEEQLARSEGKSPTDLGVELQYLVQELRTDYHGAFKAIQNASSPQAAAAAFEKIFEGAGIPMLGNRENLAAQAYQMLGGSSTSTIPTARHPTSALQSYLNATTGAATKTKAAATSTIPAAVATMLATAQALVGTSYTFGGGHNGWDPVAELKKIGVDCSGFVSQVLHAGGVSLPGPLTTIGLAQNLRPGKGKDVTVYDRPLAGHEGHTLIEILGKFFESGGNSKYNPSGGVSELTAKQAAGELAEGGFKAYHPVYSGKLATNAQLKAMGLSGLSSSAGQGVNLQNLVDAVKQGVAQAATAMLQKLTDAIQTGTAKTLSNALGLSSSALVTPGAKSGQFALSTVTAGAALHSAIERLGPNASMSQIGKATGGIVAQGVSGSTQERAFQQQILNLVSTGQTKLAQQLVAAHKQAMTALGQEMYAQQTLKDGELAEEQATQLKDQTTAIQNAAQQHLTIMKAQQQKVDDMSASMVQSMKDAQQTIDDSMAGIAAAIKDAAAIQTDSSNMIVDAINDQTQIQVDQIGERGLYGLNLVAQKLQVTYDTTKAYWDQQIDAAQKSLDVLQQQADAAESAAQVNVDQVTSLQDLRVSQAQANMDQVTIQQNQRIAAAQAHADAVQLHADTTLIGPAQIAVDLNATASKSQQDVYAAQLKKATGLGDQQIATAQQNLVAVTNSANRIIQDATDTYNNTQDQANQAITSATNSLKSITDYYNNAIASAGAVLSGTQGAASIAEAGASGIVSVTNARASTQFAGSGATINIYGTDTNNAGAVGNAASWAIRTAVAA